MYKIKNTVLVIYLFVFLLLPAAHAAPEPVVIKGCLVLELVNPDDLPENINLATDSNLARKYPSLASTLSEISVTSFKNEFSSNLDNYRVLRFDKQFQNQTLINELESLSFVKKVWKNKGFYTSEMTRRPDDEQLSSQWHHEAINSMRAWAVSTGRSDVVIGIIDTGIDYTHPDLATSMWVNEEEDLNGNGIFDESDIDGLDNDNNGYVDDVIGWDWVVAAESEVFEGEDYAPADNDPADYQGHGTHCAGDAAATTNNSIGVAGTGWGCSVAALRAGWMSTNGLGLIGLVEATSAVTYAIDHDFSVISMSFGGSGGDPGFFVDALQLAYDNGIIPVAAAGNENSDAPHYPAAESMVVSVAATNEGGNRASFSNYGDWVDIAAPGDAIWSTTINGNYGSASGTSMACPVLAGTIGQIKALAPNWAPWRILLRLDLTADAMTDPGMGAGQVNFGHFVDPFVSIDSMWVQTGVLPRLFYDTEGILGLRWHKLDYNDFGVSITIEENEIVYTLGEDSLWVGDVTAGDNGLWEIPITVNENEETEGVIQLNVRIRGNDRMGEAYDYRQPVFFNVGQSRSLVINHDAGGSGRIDRWYTNSLSQLGVSSDVLNRSDVNDLSGLLDGYELVVFATGNRTINTLSNADVAVYESYLAEGGKLIISGQNIAEDLSNNNPGVLSSFLNCEFVEAHSNRLTVYGLDQPLTENIYLILAGDGGAANQNSLDVINTTVNSTPLFVYNTADENRYAGVLVQPDVQDFAFFSFGLEAINDETSSGTTRFEWFERLLNHWEMQTGVKDQETKELLPEEKLLVWPNPSNGKAVLAFNLKHQAEVEITLYNLMGQRVFGEKVVLDAGKINHALIYPETISSGSYFVNVKTKELNLTQKVFLLK